VIKPAPQHRAHFAAELLVIASHALLRGGRLQEGMAQLTDRVLPVLLNAAGKCGFLGRCSWPRRVDYANHGGGVYQLSSGRL